MACTRSFVRYWKQSKGNDRGENLTRALHVFHAKPCRNRGLQRPWHPIPLGRCILLGRTHARQTSPTPVANHPSAVGFANILLFCPAEGSNARGMFVLARCIAQINTYINQTTPTPVAFCPLGRWRPCGGLLFHIFRFWAVTILSLLRNFVLEIHCHEEIHLRKYRVHLRKYISGITPYHIIWVRGALRPKISSQAYIHYIILLSHS